MIDWRFLVQRYVFHRRTFRGFRWEYDLDGPLDNEKETEPYIIWGGDIFLDVGACIGRWTLPAAHGIFNNVIAFEPSLKAFRILEHHVKMNKLKNIRCENMAVSDRIGIGSLFSDGVMGHDTLREGNSILKGRPVRTTSIDEYLRWRGKGDLSRLVIKIDTEGAEVRVIMGAMDTIRKYHPKLVIEIHDPANEAPLREMLKDYPQRIVTGAEEPDGRIGRWLMCGYPTDHWAVVDKVTQ